MPGSCANSWPAATYTYYSGTNVATATNSVGKTTSYTYTGYGQMTMKAEFPDNTSHNINIAYSSCWLLRSTWGSERGHIPIWMLAEPERRRSRIQFN